MHLPKSSFLLLLTAAALTSVAVASRPSSATPPAALDADVTIAQRDVDHEHTHDHTHSVHTGAPWTDEFSILHGPYIHTNVESARVNTKIAKRVAATSTAAAGEDKENSNFDYQGQKITDPLATGHHTHHHHHHHHNETKDETKTHTKLRDPTGLPESHKIKSTSVVQPAGTSLSSALPNQSSSNTIPPTSSPAASASTPVNTSTKLAKRSYGTFEYVYDSSTKTVTAPHTTGHYDTSKLSTKTKTKTKESYHSGWLSGSI